MIVAVRKINNKIEIDFNLPISYNHVNKIVDYDKHPYNYKFIDIDLKYEDCQPSDFNDDLTFNISKYNSRKEKEKNIELIGEYKRKLSETDYKAIKYAEGLISETDYAPIKAERENYRKAINSLEISIK